MNKVLGVVGAGKLGTTLGRAAADAGWDVLFTDAAPAEITSLIVESIVPEARLVSLPELARAADLVLLAVPFGHSEAIDYSQLDGKVVLDAMNYWPAVDAEVAALRGWTGSTSALVASRNPRMRLVRSLNHLGYHEYTSDARSPEVPNRRAVAVAGDDTEAQRLVAGFVNDIGFEPVLVPFDRAKQLDPNGPAFGVWLDAASMRELLGV